MTPGPQHRQSGGSGGSNLGSGDVLQVPAPFGYERATTSDDALALLERVGPEARLPAGGQGLLPMTRHRDRLGPPILARQLQIFTDAERVIAGPVVRSCGRIGGALCQADLSEDLSAVCVATGAKMVIRNRTGERILSMGKCHRGPYRTAVGPRGDAHGEQVAGVLTEHAVRRAVARAQHREEER